MRLLLLIMGLLLGGYVLFSAIGKRGQKRRLRLQEEFERTILENNHGVNDENEPPTITPQQAHDPLLDDYVGKATLRAARENASQLQAALQAQVHQDNDSANYFAPHTEPKVVKAPEHIALSILPKDGTPFTGDLLLAAIKVNYFHYGRQKIFHRHRGDNLHQNILFSVASIIEPGYFELNTMAKKVYPGVMLFMIVDMEADPLSTFDKMLSCAKQIATSIQGEVCDAQRKPLSISTITKYRNGLQENMHHGFAQQMEN